MDGTMTDLMETDWTTRRELVVMTVMVHIRDLDPRFGTLVEKHDTDRINIVFNISVKFNSYL